MSRLTEVTPTRVPTLPGSCPIGQSEFGGHCYAVASGAVFADWFTARQTCQTQYGGELVSLHSKEENEFVKDLVFGTQGVRSVWLGLTRSETGMHLSLIGASTDSNTFISISLLEK